MTYRPSGTLTGDLCFITAPREYFTGPLLSILLPRGACPPRAINPAVSKCLPFFGRSVSGLHSDKDTLAPEGSRSTLEQTHTPLPEKFWLRGEDSAP